MKVLVLHNTLNSIGGGERLCLHTIKALRDEGFEVWLGVAEQTDWAKVRKVMGITVSVDREFYIMKNVKMFGLYQRLLLAHHVLKLKSKVDVIINTYGDLLPLPTDLVYMHFPTLALVKKEPWVKYVKYTKSVFWRAYFTPYELIQNKLKYTIKHSIVLTNSLFSAEIISKYFNKHALVIYPPVEISDYINVSHNNNREDAVVSIGRMSPEKNWHLIPYIAKKLPQIRFYLIGSIRGFQSKQYYDRIVYLKNKLSVKNLEIIPNAPHSVKLKVLSRSKVYLHLYPYEHFGIAVVEAMAAGLIPVVHASGGQWLDIIEKGKYGIGYNNLKSKSIASAILEALNMWSKHVKNKVIERAKIFSDSSFRKKIAKIVKKYVEYKLEIVGIESTCS
ncbi:MAG: hypothetical protein B6U76_08945 [Desulfurococcales archaeon ex4484_217_2]|nr:MAG: hypothetical protein B6U76_08945 [Desulfurococcales archaeon ex4484_217_2]